MHMKVVPTMVSIKGILVEIYIYTLRIQECKEKVTNKSPCGNHSVLIGCEKWSGFRTPSQSKLARFTCVQPCIGMLPLSKYSMLGLLGVKHPDDRRPSMEVSFNV